MKSIKSWQAVLTAGLVNSTLLTPDEEKKLVLLIEESLQPCIYEFYRGDSFQALHPTPLEALKTALLCRTAAISINQENKEHQFDVRLSIGIAPIQEAVTSIQTSKELPFIMSGKNFDKMALTENFLSMITSNDLATAGLEAIAFHADQTLKEMTGRQAGVIFELLQGKTQQEVAESLGKSKSTIHQHVSAGKYHVLETLIKQYQQIIHLIV